MDPACPTASQLREEALNLSCDCLSQSWIETQTRIQTLMRHTSHWLQEGQTTSLPKAAFIQSLSTLMTHLFEQLQNQNLPALSDLLAREFQIAIPDEQE
jgi:hypothetical protein